MKNFFTYLSIAVIGIIAIVMTFQKKYSWMDAPGKIGQKNETEPSEALQAFQFYSDVRSFPAKDIPAGAYFKAFDYSRRYLAPAEAAFRDEAAASSWECIGPENIGGRTLCLAIHPTDTSLLFMGSASGGLWKSTSGGLGANAWTYVETGFPSLAVSSIAIDKNNPAVMYIGTGENYGYQYSQNGLVIRVTRGVYGMGILKSTDGGITWVKSLDWTQDNKRGIWKVIINPVNSNILYAGTSEGVYKSIDAGINWTLVLDAKMVMDLEIHPTAPSILYASVGNLTGSVPLAKVGIYKTSDSGGTWTKLGGGLPSTWSGKATLVVYKTDPNIIFASISNLDTYVGYYRSTNGGTTWTRRSYSISSGNQGWYANGHFVNDNNSNLVLVGMLDNYKSTNGGASFIKKSNWSAWYTGRTPAGQPEGPSNFVHADIHDIISNPKDPNKVYVLADGGLYRSNNFGDTYYSCNGGYVTSQFYNGFTNFDTDSLLCIGGLQDNRAAIYEGSKNWYKIYQGDGMWCGMDRRNKNTLYCSYTYGSIDRSDNYGSSFIAARPPQSSTTNSFVSPFVVSTYNPDYVYAAGSSFYRSINRGSSWSIAYGKTVFAGRKALSMAVPNTSKDTIYCGLAPSSSKAAGIVISKNAGQTWTEITGTTLPNQYPTDIAVNPNNSAELYVTFGGYGNGHLFTSPNAGASWTDISSNLPNVPHFAVVVDPLYPQHIYAGNELGVYLSIDGGINWMEFKTGMPYAMIFDLKIVDANRHLRAVTHGNGVFERALASPPEAPIIGGITKNSAIESSIKNYPNPFSRITTFSYHVSENGRASICIFNNEGKLISKPINSEYQSGDYHFVFDRENLPAGIYYYKYEVNGKSQSGRFLIVD